MKKRITLLMALLSTTCIVLSGCSLPEKDVKEATEYIGDDASTEDSAEDEASAEKSIVVIDNLFEPLLEEAFSRIMSIQNGNAKVGSLEYGPLLIGKGASGYVIGWSSSSGGFWVDYSGNVWAETLYLKDTTIHSW